MYACNECGDEVNEQNMFSTTDGAILCNECWVLAEGENE